MGAIPIGLSGELTISPPLKKISFKHFPGPENTKECTCYSGKIFFPSPPTLGDGFQNIGQIMVGGCGIVATRLAMGW